MTRREIINKFKTDILEAGADMRATGVDMIEVVPSELIPKLAKEVKVVARELAKLGISAEYIGGKAILTKGGYVPPEPAIAVVIPVEPPAPEPEPEPAVPEKVEKRGNPFGSSSFEGDNLT